MFRPVFINGSFACQYGKGPIRAAFKVQHDMRVARMKWGDDVAVIKIDARKFFYLTPKTSIKGINEAALRSSSAQAVAEIMFVKMAQEQQLDDTAVAEFPELFVQWDENWRGKAGDIVRDEGQLYRSIHDVTDAGQNRKPSENPSMWTRIGNPLEEFPEWIQPLGAHDAYSKGAKVSHNGKKWTSDSDGNVWEPGVYGWTEYVEPAAASEAAQEPAGDPDGEPGE